jgi:hypothetical protein
MPADEAVGGVHGDGADGVLAEVLRDLEREVVLRAEMPGFVSLRAFRIFGSLPGSNSTSTTGPMTWTTLPLEAG